MGVLDGRARADLDAVDEQAHGLAVERARGVVPLAVPDRGRRLAASATKCLRRRRRCRRPARRCRDGVEPVRAARAAVGALGDDVRCTARASSCRGTRPRPSRWRARGSWSRGSGRCRCRRSSAPSPAKTPADPGRVLIVDAGRVAQRAVVAMPDQSWMTWPEPSFIGHQPTSGKPSRLPWRGGRRGPRPTSRQPGVNVSVRAWRHCIRLFDVLHRPDDQDPRAIAG